MRSHLLSDLFPDLDKPEYQTLFEKLGFMLVTATITGILLAITAVLVLRSRV
jgi:hypothetical protein